MEGDLDKVRMIGRRWAIVGAAIAAGAIAVACTSEHGRDFDLSKADSFRPGVTTFEEAVTQLGKPSFIRRYRDGRTGAAWQYVKGTTFFGGGTKGVGIIFDANGVMERVTSRTEIGKTE
jgi:hypothetical protein